LEWLSIAVGKESQARGGWQWDSLVVLE
jgi:hypothetical protein